MNRREREVRRYANEVLDELGVQTPPVDPRRIAAEHGLSVDEQALPSGVFGALWKKGDSFGIIVSDSCPTAGHRRFSLAHELGHYHVDGHVDAMFVGETEVVPSMGGLFETKTTDWSAKPTGLPLSFSCRPRNCHRALRTVGRRSKRFVRWQTSSRPLSA